MPRILHLKTGTVYYTRRKDGKFIADGLQFSSYRAMRKAFKSTVKLLKRK